MLPVQKGTCQKKTVKVGRVVQGSCQGNEASHTVAHQKEWEARVFFSHPAAGGQHRNCVLLHALHFCPASRAGSVTDVVVAPAKEPAGPASFAQAVKIWGDVLGIAMADEHHGSRFSNDGPSVCGQKVVWGGLGSRQEECQDDQQQVTTTGVHVKTDSRGQQVNSSTGVPE